MVERVSRLLVCLAVVGCGDDSAATDAASPGSDAAPPDGGAPFAPAAPALPSPLVLTPCPAGWSERPLDDGPGTPAVCEPWAAADGPGCGPGEVRFPGEDCAPLGGICPSGAFAEGLPTDGTVLYVDAAAGPGGDGTLATPFASPGDALAIASPGQTVALAAGVHVGAVTVPEGVTLRGACTADTIVETDPSEAATAVLQIYEPDVVVRDVTLRGRLHQGIRIDRGGATLSDVRVDDSIIFGMAVSNGGTLVADGLEIRDVRQNSRGGFGEAIAINASSSMELRRTWISDAYGFSVLIFESGTNVRLEDSVIRSIDVDAEDGNTGVGLSAVADSVVDLERIVVEDVKAAGFLFSTRAAASLTDVLIRDAEGQPDGRLGQGIQADGGSALTLSRVRLSRVRTAAILTLGFGSRLDGSDVVVTSTRAQASDGMGGVGISASVAATAALERIWMVNNRTADLVAFEDDATVDAMDVTALNTLPREADGIAGRGIAVQDYSSVAAERVVVDGSHEVGASVAGEAAMLTLTDATVARVQSRPSDRRTGRGINAQLGATLLLDRVSVLDTREVGIFVLNATANLTDVTVQNTMSAECFADDCPETAGGHALSVTSNANATVERFILSDSELAGIQISLDADLVARVGEVARNLIGANIQVPGFDQTKITDRVTYRDNESNVTGTALPVPQATSGL